MIKKSALLFILVIILYVATAEPAHDLLEQYKGVIGEDAYSAALYINPPEGIKLTSRELEIYRFAFGEGYWASEYPEQADLYMWYVLNNNSKKFHRPACMAAESMSASNREDVHERRSSVINQGFVPCKMCNP